MRILYYNTFFYSNSGAGIHARNFYKAAKKFGLSIEAFPNHGELEQGVFRNSGLVPFKKHLRSKLYEITPLSLRTFYSIKYGKQNLYRNLQKHLRINRYDWILHRNVLGTTSHIMKLRNLGYHVALENNGSSISEIPVNFLFKDRLMEMEVNSWKNAEQIFSVSEFLGNFMIERGIDRNKIHIVQNGIDSKIFELVNVEQKMDKKDSFILGYVGSYQKYHRLDLLVDCIPRLSRINNLVIHLIGDGQGRNKIKEKVKQLGVEDKTKFIGWVPHNNIPAYISKFDIAILPDNLPHGSPQKIIEYLATGIPVIVSKNVKLSDDLKKLKHLVIYDPDNEKLDKVIIGMYSQIDELNESAQCKRVEILRRYSWEGIAIKINNILSESL